MSESLQTIFWVKILKFFDADPGSRNLFDSGSGIRVWKKFVFGIRATAYLHNTVDASGSRKLDWNGLEVLWRLRNLKTLVLKAGGRNTDLALGIEMKI
jgi:hypothetical protein